MRPIPPSLKEKIRHQWLDGNDYRTSPKAEPLWISEIASTGSGSDLRGTINYMLVAAFEHFGHDTGKRVIERLSENDERLKFLIEPRKN